MADFALRAAYYLNLPAKGPVPLPKITQRWTVPRDNFIFKKSQENYERVTVRRLIQIQDGNPEVVRRWLGFVRRHVWYGVGMKADVFEFESTDVVKNMDENEEAVRIGLEKVDWSLFGRRKGLASAEDVGDAVARKGWADAPARRKAEAGAAVTAPGAVKAAKVEA
jgi:small subunit ribosomal protein S10